MREGKKLILSCFWASLVVAQIILIFAFGMVHETRFKGLTCAGWIIWAFSAILGWLPILVLKKKGGVEKNENGSGAKNRSGNCRPEAPGFEPIIELRSI